MEYFSLVAHLRAKIRNYLFFLIYERQQLSGGGVCHWVLKCLKPALSIMLSTLVMNITINIICSSVVKQFRSCFLLLGFYLIVDFFFLNFVIVNSKNIYRSNRLKRNKKKHTNKITFHQ